jgi:hypothetical protein
VTDDELKELVASLAVSQQKTDEELKNFVKSIHIAQQKTDEQMKRTEEQMKRTDKKLEKVSELLGNIGRNQGDVSEEFFYNSLLEDIRLGDIHFDSIAKSLKDHRGKTQEEYDIVMTNGHAVGIVEIKYKAHENDLDKLERKMQNFKKLYPRYQDCKIYGALAAFNINDTAKKAALERGFFVLQRSGKVLHTEGGENLKVM